MLSKRFEFIWEDKWTVRIAQQGEGLIKEWSEELAPFDDEILDEAATRARRRFSWPPSIAEFAEVCREVKKGLPDQLVVNADASNRRDMTNQQWKSWIKIIYGITVAI